MSNSTSNLSEYICNVYVTTDEQLQVLTVGSQIKIFVPKNTTNSGFPASVVMMSAKESLRHEDIGC